MTLYYRDAFLSSLQTVNEFYKERTILNYQLSILKHGTFLINCPWTNKSISPTQCYTFCYRGVLPKACVAYRFSTTKPLWLIAPGANAAKGFPISEAYEPFSRTSIYQSETITHELNVNHGVIDDLETDYLSSKGASTTLNTERRQILIGHPNFAHHLWNELSGLLEIVKLKKDLDINKLEVVCTYEPILPIELLFNTRILKITDMEHMPVRRECILTHLGSTIVSEQIRKKVIKKIKGLPKEAHISAVMEALSKFSPIIWVTARLHKRTIDNQGEFLLVLSKKLLSKFALSAIIFDGFSYPHDFEKDLYRPRRRQFVNMERRVTQFINGVINLLSVEEQKRVFNISGVTVPEALSIAENATYYVSHAGSIQHKIGWTFNISGYIHSNEIEISNHHQKWAAAQLEKGVLPTITPNRFVRDEQAASSRSEILRNIDYVFVDIEGLTDNIVMDIERKLDAGEITSG